MTNWGARICPHRAGPSGDSADRGVLEKWAAVEVTAAALIDGRVRCMISGNRPGDLKEPAGGGWVSIVSKAGEPLLKPAGQLTLAESASAVAAAAATAAGSAEAAPPAAAPRVVFISASALKSEWRSIPAEVMASALFCFGSKRCWLFPETAAERTEQARQPTDYAGFEPELKALIRAKDAAGHLVFLKPPTAAGHGNAKGDWPAVSAWLQTVDDPVTGSKYGPIEVDPGRWRRAGQASGTPCVYGDTVRTTLTHCRSR